jgi:ribonuclease VapC
VIAVDASILVGRMRREGDVLAIPLPDRIVIAASTLVEAYAWCSRNLAARRSPWLAQLVAQPGVRVDSITPAMAELAGEALRTMGRGTGHRAQLNFGDAMVYAHARLTGLPLLCKGDDFCHTGLWLDPRSIAV